MVQFTFLFSTNIPPSPFHPVNFHPSSSTLLSVPLLPRLARLPLVRGRRFALSFIPFRSFSLSVSLFLPFSTVHPLAPTSPSPPREFKPPRSSRVSARVPSSSPRGSFARRLRADRIIPSFRLVGETRAIREPASSREQTSRSLRSDRIEEDTKSWGGDPIGRLEVEGEWPRPSVQKPETGIHVALT